MAASSTRNNSFRGCTCQETQKIETFTKESSIPFI